MPHPMTRSHPARIAWAETAGVLGALFAAFCCAGVPLIVSALAAVGLSALRDDRILWPLMGLSLVAALWGLWSDRRSHHRPGPIILGALGAAALVYSVVFAHGTAARVLIDGGAVMLLGAVGWNVWARGRC